MVMNVSTRSSVGLDFARLLRVCLEERDVPHHAPVGQQSQAGCVEQPVGVDG